MYTYMYITGTYVHVYIAFVNICMHHVSTQYVYVNIYSKAAVEVGWMIFLFPKPHLLCITVDFEIFQWDTVEFGDLFLRRLFWHIQLQ